MPKSFHGILHEFKHGALHSGSKKGPVVKNKKQALAIAFSEQREKMKDSESKGESASERGKDKPAVVKKGKGGKGRFTPFVKSAASQADALDVE